ncbi:carbohydrate ABC transporter permease [Glycomyces sp. NRRL B-16210]|uniref:carbohydrate ABC transporter permease n=1 Tax=Glycomyces sp. NRRL B-16210 TaxID=1463821 RepID=UPI0004C0A903|nr:sugar ABC transporter permease [Glycomyces sp. NRRL B-16210]
MTVADKGTAGSTAPPAPTGRERRQHRRYRLDLHASPYLYIAPFFVLFAVFGLFPLGFTAWVSTHEWSLLSDEHVFVGVGNYETLLTDPYFWNALGNTLSILLLATVPQLLAALLLAHVLTQRLRGQTFWRMGMLLPNVASVVAVAVIFSQLFGRDFGLINWVLDSLGAGRIDWQAGTASSHVAIAVMVAWKWTGYNALIYLAAMQAVPREVYEAAHLDGASRLQQLFLITVPMIRPTIVFTVIVSTIYGLQIFAEPQLFGGGGPNGVTGGASRQFQTLTLYLYEHGFNRGFQFGYASAVAWTMFAVIVLIALLNYLFLRRIRSAS